MKGWQPESGDLAGVVQDILKLCFVLWVNLVQSSVGLTTVKYPLEGKADAVLQKLFQQYQ